VPVPGTVELARFVSGLDDHDVQDDLNQTLVSLALVLHLLVVFLLIDVLSFLCFSDCRRQ